MMTMPGAQIWDVQMAPQGAPGAIVQTVMMTAEQAQAYYAQQAQLQQYYQQQMYQPGQIPHMQMQLHIYPQMDGEPATAQFVQQGEIQYTDVYQQQYNQQIGQDGSMMVAGSMEGDMMSEQ